jgi:glycerol-3-phosphate dehydrogenase (NAD(P)+)
MSLGFELGKGRVMVEILGERRSVAEGAHTVGALADHIKGEDIEMPICAAMDMVLNQGAALDDIIKGLLGRPYRAEQDRAE